MSAVERVEKLFDNPRQSHYDGDARGTVGHPIGRRIRIIPTSKQSDHSKLLEVKEVSWNFSEFTSFLDENGVDQLDKILESHFFTKTKEEIKSCLSGSSEKQKEQIAQIIINVLEKYKSYSSVSLKQQFCDFILLQTVSKIRFDIFGKRDDEEIANALAKYITPRYSIEGNLIVFRSVNHAMIQKIKSIKADFKESQSYNEIEIEFDFLN
jgi:hypothetical protein